MKVNKREAAMAAVHLRCFEQNLKSVREHVEVMSKKDMFTGLDEALERALRLVNKESRRLAQLLAGGSSDLSEDNNNNMVNKN